jgi:predicted adenylyl cyclase CyaB
MPRNVEIKVRVHDVAALRSRVERMSDTRVEILSQKDIFYVTPRGRLKLRVLALDRCELIQYERPDERSARISTYELVRADDPDAFARILGTALPVRGVVSKRRELYRIGKTRVHIDEVERLGAYLELEVVLSEDQTPEQGEQTAKRLMETLGISSEDLIPDAYIDLLERTE